MECWIGWQDALFYKGRFTLDEVSHSGPPDQLTLRARSADFKGSIKRKREQSYHGVKLGDILSSIAARNGLQLAMDASLASTPIDHLDQTSESDINLLTRLGEQYGAVATVKDNRLVFKPAGTGTTASGTEIPAITINRRDGDQHQYQRAERNSDYTGVQTHWQDTGTGEQQTVTVGSDENAKVLRHPHPNQAEAESAAKAEWRKLNRAGGKLTLTLAEGLAELYPETPVNVVGFKAEIDGTDWVTERVVHTVSEGGFTTQGELEVKG
ncbi:phage late control D family protein [Nitrincola iocasae]|uniref:Phage late control D family protein n=1 Tax=Nitrincola iocasae TaxID=2614693 RepID=A0A5J6LDM7_9GAMM|nr:phage late control D family protein [Nitrincola iocasae]